MALEKSILKNITWLIIANAITKPIWFIFFIFAANVLKLTNFGIYTYSISYLALWGLIIDFGLDSLIIREIAQNKNLAQTYFNNTLTFRIFASVLVIICVILFNNLLVYDQKITTSIILMCLFTVFLHLFSLCRAFFRAFEKIKYEAISIIIEKFSSILFAGLALLLSLGLYGFMGGLILGNITCFIFCLIVLIKSKIIIQFKFETSILKETLRKAVPFIMMAIFIVMYFKLSSVMLLMITGSKDQVGLYNSSYRLIEMYSAIPILLVTPIYPVIARTFLNNKLNAIDISTKILKLLMLISFALSTIVFFDYSRINNFLFHEEFSSAAKGLQIIILTTIPLSMNVLLSTTLAAIGKQKYAAYSVGIISMLNLGMNYVLIHEFNFIGASISTLIAESLVTCFYIFFVFKYFAKLDILKFSIKLTIICLMTGLLIVFSIQMNINVIITIVISFISFLLLSVVSKILPIYQLREYIQLMLEKKSNNTII